MTPWLSLSASEARRVTRFLGQTGRENPVFLVVLGLGAAGLLWLSARSGRSAAALALAMPSGLTSLLIFLLVGGVLLGMVLAASAPRFDGYDEQVRLVPVTRLEAFAGTTALPLLATWTILTVPLGVFGWRLFATVGVALPAAWGGMLMLAYVLAAAGGAALVEAWRGRGTGRGYVLGVLALAASVLAAAGLASLIGAPWWSWLAGPLPGGLIANPVSGVAPVETPQLVVACAGLIAVGALIIAGWLALGVQPSRQRREREHVRSRVMGRGLVETMSRWLILTALRDARVRRPLVMAPLFGGVFLAGSRLALGRSAGGFVTFTALMVILLATIAPVALSAEFTRGGWLWRTLPTGGVQLGLAWWATTSLVTAAVAAVALAPLMTLARPSQVAEVAVLVLLGAPAPAAAGRLLPWRHQSNVRQLATGVVEFALFAGAVGAAAWLSTRLGVVAGPLIGLAAAVATTSAICVLAPWRSE